ncbi:MAG: ISAs1 family transposase [Rhodospirillaceae bacterium]|nr:ISAs1 family transposase [Rhodospirillaceae bacterium]
MREAQTVEKGHGRIEIRRIALSSEAVNHLDWPGLAQIARLERRREIRGRESVEIAYLITILLPEKAGPERLMALARAHWAIENRLHYVRDVSFNEDRCRTRAAARPLASRRNLAIAIIRRSGIPIPEAREIFRENRDGTIQAVTANGIL